MQARQWRESGKNLARNSSETLQAGLAFYNGYVVWIEFLALVLGLVDTRSKFRQNTCQRPDLPAINLDTDEYFEYHSFSIRAAG